MRVITVALFCLVGNAQGLAMKPKHMDNHKCKTMCQRFGMKALGPEFSSIKNPTVCCTKCDEVYKSEFLEIDAKPHAAPQPEAPKPKDTQPQGAEVVKR